TQLVGDLLHEPRDVGPRELPVGPVIAPNAGHPRFRQRVDRVEPAEPVVQRLRRLRRHLLPPTSPREAIALLRAGKPPRPPAEVTRGRCSRWRVTLLRLALQMNAPTRDGRTLPPMSCGLWPSHSAPQLARMQAGCMACADDMEIPFPPTPPSSP